jgi:hypothetical protein
MKKSILPLMLLLFAATSGYSQTPVPQPDTVGNPVQQGDPAIETLPPGLDYVDDKKRIRAEELPDPVRQTLESGTRYSNWKDAMIFHDRNKDEYIIEFDEAGKSTIHRFNKEGEPIITKDTEPAEKQE